MNNILDYLEDYAEYNDTIEPEYSSGIVIGLLYLVSIAAAVILTLYLAPVKIHNDPVMFQLYTNGKTANLFLNRQPITEIPVTGFLEEGSFQP